MIQGVRPSEQVAFCDLRDAARAVPGVGHQFGDVLLVAI
jgi:hypothetical protein